MKTSNGSQPIVQTLLSVFLAITFFGLAMVEQAKTLQTMMPQKYPDSPALKAMLTSPEASPMFLVFLISPMFYALTTGLIFNFSMSAGTGVSGTFNTDSIIKLRLAGVFLGLGTIAEMAKPYLCDWINPGLTLAPPNNTQTMLLVFISGALVSLSRNGNILFRHAKRLKSDLDEIV